jgi:hypothetical protein
MTEADRIAAQRAHAQEAAVSRARVSEVHAKLAEIADLQKQAIELVPLALAALVRNDYPGLVQMDVYPPEQNRLFGGGRRAKPSKRGVFPMYKRYSHTSSMGETWIFIYLVSDGNFVAGARTETVAQYADNVRGCAGFKKDRHYDSQFYSIGVLSQIVAWLAKTAES